MQDFFKHEIGFKEYVINSIKQATLKYSLSARTCILSFLVILIKEFEIIRTMSR